MYVIVTEINSCSMIEDKGLKMQRLMSDITGRPHDADTEYMFTRCDAGGNKTCSNCVASGYKLVNAKYEVPTTGELLPRLAYVVTGCQCAPNKPLNIVEQTPEHIYMESKFLCGLLLTSVVPSC